MYYLTAVFIRKNKLVLQDDNPVQKSKQADHVKYLAPPLLPHLLWKRIAEKAKEDRISRELYDEFVSRVKETLLPLPVEVIE